MRKIKLISYITFLVGFIFFSCKKETKIIYQTQQADSAYLSITNASPSISNLLFYVDNHFIPLPDSPFSFGTTTFHTYINAGNQINPTILNLPYIKIPAGYRQLSFNSVSPDGAFSMTSYFKLGVNYSIFIADTVAHGQAQCVLLQDNIGVTDSTHGLIRFINLSPDSPPMDLYAFIDAGMTGYKVFSNCGYLPNDNNSVVNAQSFSTIDAAPYYFIATETGTNNIILEGGLIINGKSVVTIYAKGFVAGTGENAVGVGVISYQQK
ncbi:MAG TPA: DUF4397 domain-containing protein [Puia sp.]|nr:DUF4397 domain-containing protein [Puia sp.]